MTTKVLDNTDAHRYEIYQGDERAGLLEYHLHGNEIAFLHTEISPPFEGRGLGSALARHVLDEARERGQAVRPYCTFIRDWMLRHPDYIELVPDAQRARFGL
jgi:uncharacterized protein